MPLSDCQGGGGVQAGAARAKAVVGGRAGALAEKSPGREEHLRLGAWGRVALLVGGAVGGFLA